MVPGAGRQPGARARGGALGPDGRGAPVPLTRGRWSVALLVAVAACGAADGAGPTPSEPTTTAPSAPTTAEATSTTLDARAVAPTDVFVTAEGGTDPVGRGPLRTYAVDVEEGIPVDPAAFAAAVDATLADPRGWTADGGVSLQRVGPGDEASFRVRLATPATTDGHCAPLDTYGELSCRNGADVMINLVRWVEGSTTSELPLPRYREYLVSHEVGHALGHEHEPCSAPGAVAPVMLQQSLGLDGCRPNPWPFPGR